MGGVGSLLIVDFVADSGRIRKLSISAPHSNQALQYVWIRKLERCLDECTGSTNPSTVVDAGIRNNRASQDRHPPIFVKSLLLFRQENLSKRRDFNCLALTLPKWSRTSLKLLNSHQFLCGKIPCSPIGSATIQLEFHERSDGWAIKQAPDQPLPYGISDKLS